MDNRVDFWGVSMRYGLTTSDFIGQVMKRFFKSFVWVLTPAVALGLAATLVEDTNGLGSGHIPPSEVKRVLLIVGAFAYVVVVGLIFLLWKCIRWWEGKKLP
jgi:hypothetical protein